VAHQRSTRIHCYAAFAVDPNWRATRHVTLVRFDTGLWRATVVVGSRTWRAPTAALARSMEAAVSSPDAVAVGRTCDQSCLGT